MMAKTHIKILSQCLDDADMCLRVDAQTTLQEVYQSADCPELLHQTLSGSISWQKRNGTTAAEAIYSHNLAPQWIAALLALGARAEFPDRTGMLSDFLRRMGAHHNHLKAVLVPLNVPGRVWGKVHVGRTPTDDPIVSATAVVDLGEEVVRRAHLALTGVWREQVRLAEAANLLVGQPFNHATIGQVKDVIEAEVSPQDDFRGTAVYRQAMAGVLTHRALLACMEKGRGVKNET
jgi:CO/xanthine dehydrogenase FAD-binding subunit